MTLWQRRGLGVLWVALAFWTLAAVRARWPLVFAGLMVWAGVSGAAAVVIGIAIRGNRRR